MKKASKPVPKTPAKKPPAIKSSAAEPKAKPSAKPKAKPTSKPKTREAPAQLELFPILKRLAQSAERLALAVERLAAAAVPSPTVGHQPHDGPGQPAELLADLTTPGESVADLATPAVDLPVDDATEEE